jgi:hypothetical protein
MLQPTMDTLLGDDVGACLAPPDPPHMGVVARRASARVAGLAAPGPELLDIARQGAWTHRFEDTIENGHNNRRPKDVTALRLEHGIVDTLDAYRETISTDGRAALVVRRAGVEECARAPVTAARGIERGAAHGTSRQGKSRLDIPPAGTSAARSEVLSSQVPPLIKMLSRPLRLGVRRVDPTRLIGQTESLIEMTADRRTVIRGQTALSVIVTGPRRPPPR